MLIDLHAHHITAGMLDRHPHWGPRFTGKGLEIGDWRLGTKEAERPDEEAKIGWLEDKSVERRLEQMAAKDTDRLVLSVPSHMYMYWAGDFGNEYAAICNEELAAYCAGAPDGTMYYWGHANLADPLAATKELERAVTTLGAQGLGMGGANFGGLEAHDEALYPVWEKVCELGVPVYVHGYNQSVTWGAHAADDPFDTTSILGMCMDEAKLFWYLINGGVLDRFPELRVYITHAGGFVPFQLRRFHETNLTMCPDSRNEKGVLDYLDNFFFDLDLHSPHMRRAIVDEVGADRLLYGTNFGGADSHDHDLTADIDLTEEDRTKIRSANALALLRF